MGERRKKETNAATKIEGRGGEDAERKEEGGGEENKEYKNGKKSKKQLIKINV